MNKEKKKNNNFLGHISADIQLNIFYCFPSHSFYFGSIILGVSQCFHEKKILIPSF
jgi:hypothetical protein